MTMLLAPEEKGVETALDTRHLQVADDIGCRLVRDAVWSGGRCNWLVWTKEAYTGMLHPVLTAAPADLYLGTAGIGLYLAHLSTVTHDRAQRQAAQGAALRVRDELAAHRPEGTGFYSGAGGAAWALVRMGEALEEEGWITTGLDALAAVAERAGGTALLDLLAGHAGLVAGLVDCGERFVRPALLQQAERLAGLLVDAAQESAEGTSWPSGVGEMRNLLGLSHGTTGIALALLELNRVRPHPRWEQAARGALRYERALFDPARRNWPDFRSFPGMPAPPGHTVAWCHGATGVGFARLRMLDLLPDDTQLLPELDVAVGQAIASLNVPMTAATDFTLCHGAAGHSELLLMAGQRFGRADAVAAARRVGDLGIELVHQPRHPWACGIPDCGESPSLMTGTAGVGMHYLRLYDPAAMPGILLPHVPAPAPAA